MRTWRKTVGGCLFSVSTVTLAVIPLGATDFIRGDVNADAVVDLSDAVSLLGCLFVGTVCPTCQDAADTNDDGSVDISDAIFPIDWLFLGEPGLPPPDTCGTDPTPDGLDCAAFPPCVPPPPRFIWPVPGTGGIDWVINNYVDLNSGTGNGTRDYTGRVGNQAKTYDGHNGVDIDTPSFRTMDRDEPKAVAAAAGRVASIDDGERDRNVSCSGRSNQVTIEHPGGFRTMYLHLKHSFLFGAGTSPGDSTPA